MFIVICFLGFFGMRIFNIFKVVGIFSRFWGLFFLREEKGLLCFFEEFWSMSIGFFVLFL